MTVIRFSATCKEENAFVEKLRNGEIQKDIPLNHGKIFADKDEEFAVRQFHNFLNSMSYVLVLDRKRHQERWFYEDNQSKAILENQ